MSLSNSPKLSSNNTRMATTISCQTDHGPNIPYYVTSPLPPIFNSQLCFKTPPIKFLAKSLPNLQNNCWRQPDTNYTDKAEEALAEQHDRQVREFYLDERERIRTLRQHQGHIIMGTLDNSSDSSSNCLQDSSSEDY